jgi:hypothetical protein
MIIYITLKDGVTLKSDSNLGLNLSTVEEVMECLEHQGFYRLTLSNGQVEKIYSHEVREVSY